MAKPVRIGISGPRAGIPVVAAIGVGLLGVILYAPALKFGFVDWDDDVLILQNPDMWGISPAHLKWMFTTTFFGHYQPLTWLSFALNYEAGGLRPVGYHLVNILLHAGSGMLVFGLALKIFDRTMMQVSEIGRIAAAVLAALIFSAHPLRVESVAWVTERRDVLSGFFLFACALCYLQYTEISRHRRLWYAMAVLLLVLSLLSKVWGMTLPVVLLVLDVYPLRRIDPAHPRRSILSLLKEKILFALPALAAGLMAMHAQRVTVGKYIPRDLIYRIMQAFYGLTFYFVKTIAPLNLSPVYEHPATLDPLHPRFAGPVVVVVTITLVTFLIRRRVPAMLTTWLIYLIVVSPVLGLVQTWPLFVADRYSYIACVPFAILIGACFALVVAKLNSPSKRLLPVVVSVACVLALFIATRRQLEVWRDSESLWRAALNHDANSATGLLGMGMICLGRQQFDAAIGYLHRAHDSAPEFAQVSVSLAGAYAGAGKIAESAAWYRRATTQPSVSPNDLLSIGAGLTAIGKYREAEDALRQVVQQNMNDAEAHFRLGQALDLGGQRDDAVTEYQRAVEFFEPLVQSGLDNPDVNMEAYYFQQACTRLTQLLNARGDGASAIRFQQKLAMLKAKSPRRP